MNKFPFTNKYVLLNIKPRYRLFVFTTIIISVVILILSIKIKTYDSFKVIGFATNDKIVLKVSLEKVSEILKSDYLCIDKKQSKFLVHSVSEIEIDPYTYESYQTVIISTSDNYIDNLSMDITFYKNKQRIIVKLLNLLKWKE